MQQREFRPYKLAFLLPGLLVLLAIILFPLLFTIRVSLSGWDAIVPGLDWAGVRNYVGVFNDVRFWQSLGRLSLMAVGTVLIQYVLGFALALLVWRDIRFRRLWRVLFLIPMMTTPVIMSVIWRTIFHESLGPANDLLGAIGLGPYPWLTSAGWAVASVMLVEIWQWTPFMFLLLLAGLISLPREPFLAAAIDGAGPVRTFFNVTFPLLAPVSIGAIIIRLIEASKLMETVYVLTSGGPGTATETTGYYIYIRGLRDFQIGYAAALSITYLVIMIVLLTIVAKLLVRVFVGGKTA
ncbi:carbohydrate ABC transporter permease [Aureimonas phyllosphaerae]|uniref:Multiple sugar transport system permease protein n=1 Tax=Aureimonas phyllosphaerae TaxID=1166078 RepID=A0A7W6FWH6_9HYPH|nr:sugar ABC transporter permease [Aureimonas phyllosphaerae]MBB3938223.1 multiple sugar transport system permease protein [Aureimonas phyllosphaerae]MBB3962231.1 multiple sugar transport system permease protein [Aureimonas phyllosphaerae]SFF58347.1 carbohydrate ABC transporter membrane protein 1, CUT1 family [Aureimonas phyllosphaerae]